MYGMFKSENMVVKNVTTNWKLKHGSKIVFSFQIL